MAPKRGKKAAAKKPASTESEIDAFLKNVDSGSEPTAAPQDPEPEPEPETEAAAEPEAEAEAEADADAEGGDAKEEGAGDDEDAAADFDPDGGDGEGEGEGEGEGDKMEDDEEDLEAKRARRRERFVAATGGEKKEEAAPVPVDPAVAKRRERFAAYKKEETETEEEALAKRTAPKFTPPSALSSAGESRKRPRTAAFGDAKSLFARSAEAAFKDQERASKRRKLNDEEKAALAKEIEEKMAQRKGKGFAAGSMRAAGGMRSRQATTGPKPTRVEDIPVPKGLGA